MIAPILCLLVFLFGVACYQWAKARRRRLKAERNRSLRRRSVQRWKYYGNYLGRPRSHRHRKNFR